MGEISVERIELMADMSLAADRPLNWNLLGSLSPDRGLRAAAHVVRPRGRKGAHVVALTLPDLMRMRSSRDARGACPGWGEVVALPDDERRAARRRSRTCASGLRGAGLDAARDGLAAIAAIDLQSGPASELPDGRRPSVETSPPSAAPTGRRADRRRASPERLPLTHGVPVARAVARRTDEGWEARGEVWHDERVVLGGSDAGAHVDLMCHANYPSVVLGDSVRERELLTLEDARAPA